MFLPETNIVIKKIDLQMSLPTLKKINFDFHEEFLKVFNITSSTLKYAYTIEFPYGYPIIKDGQMQLLEKNEANDFVHQHKVEFIDEFKPANVNVNLWGDFVKDCEKNTDHPLAIVLSNCVEVFTEQESGAFTNSINISKGYRFPLNQIHLGGLFGVWGTLDLILGSSENKRNDWHASAGKSCFQFLFPIPKPNSSNSFYQRSFKEIFGTDSHDLTDAIHSAINKTSPADSRTKILIFPEHYFIITENDGVESRIKKSKLQNYLFGYGWKQFKKHRDLLWDDKELMLRLKIRHNDYHFQILKHLKHVLSGKDYVLKLVDEKDKILNEVFKYMCTEFSLKCPTQSKDKFANLLEYNTPFFFHYSTINLNEKQWAIIPYYAPAINSHIPLQTRANTFKDEIVGNYLTTAKLSTLTKLITDKTNISLTTISNQAEFETKFCAKYLLANVGISKAVNKKLIELFPNKFIDIDTKIHLQKNKNTLFFNSSIILNVL